MVMGELVLFDITIAPSELTLICRPDPELEPEI
jgi:hypothetical protein